MKLVPILLSLALLAAVAPAAAAQSETSALAQARATGQPVPVVDRGTELRKVFAQPDGSFTAELFSEPVQVRRDGGWVQVDTTLAVRPDGSIAPRVIAGTLALSGGGAGEPLARFESHGQSVEIGWPGPLPEPALQGDTATYRDVRPGVDLEVRATPSGFAPRLVVRERAAAEHVEQVRLEHDVDAGGEALEIDMGDAVMHDRDSGVPVPTTLSADSLTLEPDAEFLADPETVYPLAIAPPDYHRPIWESGWAKVFSGYPNTAYWNGGVDGGEAKVGRCTWWGCNGIGTARSYFQYDHQNFLFGKNIISAEFNALNFHSPSCQARWVDFWQTDPIGPGTTWNHRPPDWTRVFIGNRFVAHGYNASCPPNWLGFDVTHSVSTRLAQGSGLFTFAFTAGAEMSDGMGWKKFASNPSLVVKYNSPPHVDSESAEDKPCAVQPHEPYTGTKTPRLSARVVDPDGGLVQAHFQWFERFKPHRVIGEHLTAEKSSGSTFNVTITEGDFTRDDQKIAFRVRGFDGRDYSHFGRWCDITVDALPPQGEPSVGSNDYPKGRQSGAPGQTGWFRLSANGDPDVVGFKYSLVNTPPDLYVAAPTGTVDIPITPEETGSQFLYVQKIDRAGNPGDDIATYPFVVGLPTPPAGHWRLDGRHTNTSAPDASGNGRDGAVTGRYSWGTGRVRDALRFDGSDGHVRTTGGPPVQTDRSFTVSAWVRMDGSVPHVRTAVSIDGNRASGFYLQWSEAMGWSFLMTHADVNEAAGSRVTAPSKLGRWTHLTGVHDAGTREIRLYVDGKLAGTAPHAPAWAATGALQIGRAKWNGILTDHFAGLIDDVRVWQRALPQREIGALATRPALEEGRWLLDGSPADASGNFHNATATSSGVTWGEEGPNGTAAHFNGVTGSLATDGPVLRTDGSFTVSAWVNADQLPGTATAVSQENTERSAFFLGYRGEHETWSLMMPTTPSGSTGFPAVTSSVPAQTGEWTHLAGVHDLAARELRIYVNGERTGTAPLPADWTPWQATGPLRIGAGRWGGVVDRWDGMIDDVRVHNGVRADQEIFREFLNPPPAAQTVHSGAIGRYVNHAGEHLTAAGPVPRSYRLESLYGLPAPDGAPNTRMLYICRYDSDTFTSTQPGCEGHPRLGELGKVYVEPQPGLHLRPLYRCIVTESGEHFESVNSNCEGQTTPPEWLLGYVRAYVPLAGHAQPDPPRDRRTSTGPVPVTYEPRERFGVISLVGGEGMQALYACQEGTDAFSSLDAACEGKQYLNRLGYVWTEPPAAFEAVPLTRCRDALTGERFDSTDTGDDCGGERLGYLMPAAGERWMEVPFTPAEARRSAADAPPVEPDPGPSVEAAAQWVRIARPDTVRRLRPGTPPPVEPVVASAPAGAEVHVLAETPPGTAGPALAVDGAGGELTVDYSRFANAGGGDWASRLELVEVGAGEPEPLASSENDADAETVTAQVEAGGTYALAAAASGPAGDYKASPLSPSGSWQVSRQTGDFTWSEPIGTPRAVPGDFAPEFALSYASGSVDGRVANTNNQASWVGEGWDLGAGFVERRYKACADDLAPGQRKTGDLCWETDNATLSLGGRSSELVQVGENLWRPVDDDGSRVERLPGPPNGARGGEHWRVTTPDGTQHYFGKRADTGSTWTVPVFGNDAREPCNGATFAASSCTQAWRWNLDYSVDRRGNSITYYYAPETNAYGLNEGAAKATYVRGGTLVRAEYGARHGADPTARTVFHTAERCDDGAATCARTAMPDVPRDQHCDTATCPGRTSPTFWSTKRLAKVTTEVRSGTGWAPIDQWVLKHSFPATGDQTTSALWLDSVTHTGMAGPAHVTSPPVRFLPAPYENRINTAGDGLPPMPKFRISTVRTSAGGEVNVVYDRDCDAGALPTPENNTTRCYPIRWTPQGELNPRNDWFAKYAVARITEDDRIAGGDLMVTNYEYLGGAGWRYNDDALVSPEYRTWSRYRGYERVRVTRGDGQLPHAAQLSTTYLYHRGMQGDRAAPGGGVRPGTVEDSRGVVIEDADQLAGFLREEIVHNGYRGPEVSGTTHEPHQVETGANGNLRSYRIDVARTRTRTAIPGDERTTLVEYTYNRDGLVETVNDRGDESTPDDDTCKRTWYARDETNWVLDAPSREQTVGVPCSTTAQFPRDALSETRTYYDGGELHEPPASGTSVRVEQLTSYDGPTPRFVTVENTTFDAYGREVASTDALGRSSTTSFTPDTGLPTSSTERNPKEHETTTTFEPLRGLPTTVLDVDNNRSTALTYDAAGRLTGVWHPGRRNVFGPSTRYRYNLRNSGTSWVATDTLTPNGAYTTSYTLLDGFLRERQTQAPGSGGGRVFTSTHYDSRGLAVKATGPEHTTGAPSGDLITVPDAQTYRQTVTAYDGAGRATAAIYRSRGQEQWRTTTEYHGNGTSIDPPQGGTPERLFTDADGRVVKRLQYRGEGPSGEHETTEYAYDRAGNLVELTDPMDNRWRYEYDLQGRRIRTVDPDTGTSTSEYDAAGQLTRSTDGRGRTLTYDYDELGRKTAVRAGDTTLAEWSYDTLPGGVGLPTGSTRYVDGAAYTQEFTGYEAASGRPRGSRVTIPAAETGLAGSYTTTFAYRPDGSPDATTLPRLGQLAPETVSHTYDAQGRPDGLTSALAIYVSRTKYSWFGDRTQITMGPEGQEAWHTQFYDDATGRLSRAFTQRRIGTISVDDTTYSYDRAGNVTRIGTDFTGAATEDQCFRHDFARRLTEAWTSTSGCGGAPGSSLGGPAPYWKSWRYDAAGNRRSEVSHDAGGDTTRTYEYPAPGSPQPHAVQSVTTTGPSGTRTESFTYDASGNTTALRGQELEWDVEGHLASMGSSRFVYDADGNRLIRRDADGKTLFLGGSELRWTESGNRTGTRYYDHGGETVAVRDASGLHYLVGDHHETSEIRIDARTLGAVKRRTDPFGNPRGTRPAWPGSRGFVGGVEDPTGLVHLGAREYDPALGRFISVDPVIDPNDPQQLSGYAYANNTPVTLSDPDGLLPAARCPDGECRFGGYKKNTSPAARFNVLRRAVGTRCPDGARRCWAVRGSYSKPKPKPKPVAPAKPRSRWQRWGDRVAGYMDVWPTGRLARPHLLPGADTESEEYRQGKTTAKTVEIASVVVPGGGWARGGYMAARAGVPALRSFAAKAGPKIKPGTSGGPTAGKSFPKSVKDQAKADDPSATCVYCGRPGTGTQVDHAIPKSKGGDATIDNAQLACPWCNPSKGAGDYPKNPPPGYVGPWPPSHWP